MRKTCSAALLLFLLSPVARAATESFRGEAVIRSIDPTRIAVFLDTDGDRRIDRGFLLTTDVPTHGSIAARFSSASVDFTEGYIRVADDKTVYDLQVAGYPEPPAAPRERKVVTLIGSALTHTRGDSGCDVDRALEKDAGACYSYGAE